MINHRQDKNLLLRIDYFNTNHIHIFQITQNTYLTLLLSHICLRLFRLTMDLIAIKKH